MEVKVPRYAARHRAPGRHKAKRGPFAGAPSWSKTFAAVTSASLGVTGAVIGGSHLTDALKDNNGNLQVMSDPRTGAAIGARSASSLDSQRNQAASRSRNRALTAAKKKAAPTPTPTVDTLLTASDSVSVDRTAAEARREDERQEEIRKKLMSADPRVIARGMLQQRGYGDTQFQCLNSLWNKESRWRVKAQNSSSGAYGIPQSLPGSKMARFGSDWRYNPVTQIKWGLWYISGRYGTPCNAWAHSKRTGWY